MNDPEVTMLDTLPNSNPIAHRKSLEAAGKATHLCDLWIAAMGVWGVRS